MRHGPAEDRSASGRDEDRELTPSGRQRTRAVVRAFLEAGEIPHTLVSSPLVRARQTAELLVNVAETLSDTSHEESQPLRPAMSPIELRRELSPGGPALRLLDELLRRAAPSAMLFGHEPDLSSLVTRLTGQDLELGLLKAMIVGIHLDTGASLLEGRGALQFVLDPATLAWQRG